MGRGVDDVSEFYALMCRWCKVRSEETRPLGVLLPGWIRGRLGFYYCPDCALDPRKRIFGDDAAVERGAQELVRLGQKMTHEHMIAAFEMGDRTVAAAVLRAAGKTP